MSATTSRAVRAGTYEIDTAHSTIEFTLSSLGFLKTRGTFAIRQGTVVVGERPGDSTVTAVVDLTSFHTNIPKRDQDVTSRRYLDTATVPELTFTGRANDDGTTIQGSLTRAEHTTPITLTMANTDPVGRGYALTATARVDRFALGVTGGRGFVPRFVDAVLRVVVR